MTKTSAVKLSCRHLWKVYGPNPDEFIKRHGIVCENGAGSPSRSASDNKYLDLFDDKHLAAVADVSFDVHVGEIFVIMGLSGSGKSTVVRCLSRLVEPTAGHMYLDGEDLQAASERRLIDLRRRSMGMVFQSFGLLPHLNVLDNIAFPLRMRGEPAAERHVRAREMAKLVGLSGREHAFPHQLSGGEQQRVGIARSLAVEPDLWFLDEPFSALDPLIRTQLQDEFLRLQQLLHKTIVFITHDILEAFRLADRIAIMRDGRVIQIGAPADIVLRPANACVAEFTRQVPLAQVMTARDVMEPAGHLSYAIDDVAPETTLDDLVMRIAAGMRSFAVIDAERRCLGHVHASAVARVLARDRGVRP